MADDLVERLRKRAKDEREIQINNEAVAEALKPQLEAFARRDGSHNTFAVRLGLNHKKCAENDAKLAADWDEAADRITALQAQNRKLVEALTPSGDTKAAYMGEFSFQSISTDEDGNEVAAKTYVPWTTIKEIMAAIRARAAIAEAEKGEG
ncbi:hypothetical protein [Neotabrizicola sp. sgz301269]|uniref:hypothetical protein n=1 Tax=Neotabrizicola sp. sgz301269 TaxID=3276282 RepID=UPI0037700064